MKLFYTFAIITLLTGVAYSEEPAKDTSKDELKKIVTEDQETKALTEQLAKIKLRIDIMEAKFKEKFIQMELEKQMAETEFSKLEKTLKIRELKKQWESEANKTVTRSDEPFKDGILTISDRRIPLNGPIIRGTGKWVADRLDYFNNKSEELPIFIVIDSSPGGSVVEGFHILQAMKSSKAPVHVVVKQYAASMAAVITTLSDHSYVFPNAVVLHHQMSFMTMGNTTQNKEWLKIAVEYEKRLLEPVAAKMKLSLDEFRKEMYKHNSDGDWEEFGDKAQTLNWVNHVIKGTKESSILKEPYDDAPRMAFIFFGKKDENGNSYKELPKLDYPDCYYLYNRDNYYKMSK